MAANAASGKAVWGEPAFAFSIHNGLLKAPIGWIATVLSKPLAAPSKTMTKHEESAIMRLDDSPTAEVFC